MKPARARIINTNYLWDAEYPEYGTRLVLVPHPHQTPKPWQVTVNRKTRRFPTHAEAITWATRKTRKRKGKK